MWDINPGGIGLDAKEIDGTWGGVGKYHEWLLNTMDDKDNYLYESFAKTKDNTCIYLGLQRAEYDY